MGKLKMHVSISLDGYAAAPDGGFDWIVYNEEVERHAHALTESADAALFGRVTYKGMQSYWPTVPGNPASSPAEIGHAQWLARATKFVVSTTLTQQEADWDRSVLLGADFAAALARHKQQQAGGDIVSFGSPGLVRSCIRLALFDELYININPVVLGSGKPLFGPQERMGVKLLNARPMQGGVVALLYAPPV